MSKSTWKKILKALRSQWILLASVSGVIIGCVVGLVMKKFDAGFYWFMWLGLPGELFLQALQLAVIPVIMANLITTAARIKPGKQGRMIATVLGYSGFMAFIASYLAILITSLTRPGRRSALNKTDLFNSSSSLSSGGLGINEMFSDLFRNIVPSNLIRDCIYTRVSKTTVKKTDEGQEIRQLQPQFSAKPNLIGLMSVSVVIGVACARDPEKSRPLVELAAAVSMIATNILRVVVKTMPVGVFSLMVTAVSTVGPLSTVMHRLGIFVVSVLGCLAIMHILVHPLVYWVLVRANPVQLLLILFRPWLTAATTTSSLVTFPVLQSTLVKFGLSERTVSFVLPLSLGLGSAGSMSFVAASCVFIAELQGNALSLSALMCLGVLCPLNVMALPSVPSASLMGIIVILESLSCSVTLVPLLFATEFILDRFRTGTNIVTMAIGCTIIDRHFLDRMVSDGSASSMTLSGKTQLNNGDNQLHAHEPQIESLITTPEH